MTEPPRWYGAGYQRMVHVAWRAPELVVEFADGSRACVEGRRLLPPKSDPVEWQRLTWSPYEIAVPSAYEIAVIPSSTVRMFSDPAYPAHLAAAADDSARRIGARIRELRQARGLSGKALAERAGLSPRRVSRIERGRHGVALSAVQTLLAAMGCTLRDVVAEPAGEPEAAALR
jgi:DNA-binding Xre family transcriptional regulator